MIWLSEKRDVFTQNYLCPIRRKFYFWLALISGGITLALSTFVAYWKKRVGRGLRAVINGWLRDRWLPPHQGISAVTRRACTERNH